MKRKLTLIIEAGKKTCFDKKTKTMCGNMLTSHFGTRWHCRLFSPYSQSSKGMDTLNEKDGLLQRHPDCLEAEKCSR